MRKNKKRLLEVHFYHEVDMLLSGIANMHTITGINAISTLTHRPIGGALHQEYVLLHLRNLYEFFYNDDPRNHALAQDFITSNIIWREVCGEASLRLHRAYQAICVYLSHLSYKRSQVRTNIIDLYNYVWREVRAAIPLFLSLLLARYDSLAPILEMKDTFLQD